MRGRLYVLKKGNTKKMIPAKKAFRVCYCLVLVQNSRQ